MKCKDFYVCKWDEYGQFWVRVSELCTGTYGEQTAQDLAKTWGEGYAVKDARHSVEAR